MIGNHHDDNNNKQLYAHRSLALNKKKKERKHFDMNQRMTLAPHDSQYNDQFPK